MRRTTVVAIAAAVLTLSACAGGHGGAPDAGPTAGPTAGPAAGATARTTPSGGLGAQSPAATVDTTPPATQVHRHGLGPHVVAVVGNLSSPLGAVGAGGAVWISEHRDDAMARLDPRTLRITRLVALPARPDPESGDLAGPGQPAALGATVWVPGYYNGRLYRLDSRTGRARSIGDPGTLCGTPYPTRQGVWTPTCTGHALGSVVRLDEHTGQSQVYLRAGDGIGSVARAGSHVWVADYAPGRLREVSETGKVLRTDRVPGCPVIAGYAYGFLWYTTPDDPQAHCRSPHVDRVYRFDPRTGTTASAPVAAGPEIQLGDGAVWIDQSAAGAATSPSVVQRIDPRTLAVTRWAHVPALSEGSTIYAGRLWITDFDTGTVAVVSLH
jgi:streptogramin lyase